MANQTLARAHIARLTEKKSPAIGVVSSLPIKEKMSIRVGHWPIPSHWDPRTRVISCD